jgi:hypothetical protein
VRDVRGVDNRTSSTFSRVARHPAV